MPIAVLGVAGVARGIAAHAWHVVQPNECTVLGLQVIVLTPCHCGIYQSACIHELTFHQPGCACARIHR